MKTEKKKAVIYVRVSTDDQAREGHSIETQLEKCQSLCNLREYQVVDTYIEPGKSGSDANRPEYLRMVEMIKTGNIDYVVAIKLDRLNRSTKNSEELFSVLKASKTALDLVLESADINTPSGRFQARISAAHGELVREEIQERTTMGVRQATLKGNVSGRPAFGYEKDKNNPIPELRKRVIINEINAQIVREVFNLCASGLSYHHIAKEMKRKYPKVLTWKDSAIQRILNNKWYIGILEYGKSNKNSVIEIIKGVIPPIIDEDLFYQCQDQIKNHKNNYIRKHNYIFAKKLICPHCTDGSFIMAGHSSYNRGSNLYLYYKCPNCNSYISEKELLKSIAVELDEIYENHSFLLSLEETATIEINDIRLQQDGSIFRWKNRSNISNFQSTFFRLSNEEQRKQIDTLVNRIHLKEDRSYITLDHIEFKRHQLNKLNELRDKNLMDNVIGSRNRSVSIAEMKPEEFEFYINELHDIVEDFSEIFVVNGNEFDHITKNRDDLLKIIRLIPRKKIYKSTYRYVYLRPLQFD